jgi:hypothetical protein
VAVRRVLGNCAPESDFDVVRVRTEYKQIDGFHRTERR